VDQGHEPRSFRSRLIAAGSLAALTGVTFAIAIAAGAAAGQAQGQAGAAPLRLLVVTGGHDYPTSFYTLFEQPGMTWDHETTSESAYRRDLRPLYDVLVLYDMPATLSAAGRANLQAFAESGKGIVVLHHALCSYNDWDWYRDLVGARYQIQAQPGRPASTYKHDETIPIAVARPHPITRDVPLTQIFDETYKGMWFAPANTVLLTTTHPLSDGPLAWISGYAPSRVVAIQLGHGREAHLDAGYRALVRNAILWSARRL
jgi:type 1 glutamine amidotransferase